MVICFGETRTKLGYLKGKMEIAMQYVNGFLFGAGFITAAVIFKVLLRVSIC